MLLSLSAFVRFLLKKLLVCLLIYKASGARRNRPHPMPHCTLRCCYLPIVLYCIRFVIDLQSYACHTQRDAGHGRHPTAQLCVKKLSSVCSPNAHAHLANQ